MSAPNAVPARATVHGDGLPLPRRYWAIAAPPPGIAMAVLDSTIANVALPTIARDFGASPAAAIWVINAYQLAILMLLLPLASLGEIVGYRHHERESGAGALHLSPPLSGARGGHQRLRGRRLCGTRADHRGGRARHRSLALAVRHQRAARDCDLQHRRVRAAAQRACAARVQLRRRAALRGDPWPFGERPAVAGASRRGRAGVFTAGRWLRARVAVGAERAATDRSDHPVRSAAHPRVLAVTGHLGLLVHGADDGTRRAAVRNPAPRSQRGADRAAHDALAARAGTGGTDCRPTCRPASGRAARRTRTAGDVERSFPAGVLSGARHGCRLHLAHGPVWSWFRILPGTEQPHAAGRRPARTQWSCRWDAGWCAPARAEPRRRHGCDSVARFCQRRVKPGTGRGGPPGADRRDLQCRALDRQHQRGERP